MPLEYRNETWHTEGSEYIGLDVARSGRIIGWRLETDNFGSQRSRYLVKYTEDDFRDFIKNVEMMLTQESYLLLEQRRLEQRRLEPEEGVAHNVETSKKKRKAATPAPAPTTTPVTTTASTTDKTRACKKKKQPKKPKKKQKEDERNPASKIPDLLQELFDGGDLCLLTKDEGRSQEHDKRMATTGEVWKKLNVKQNTASIEAMGKLGYVKDRVSGAFNGNYFLQENTDKYIHFNNIPSNALKKEKPPAAEEANYVPGDIEIQGDLEVERLKSGCLGSNIANLMAYENKKGFGYTGGYDVQRAKDTGREWSNVLAIKLHGCACKTRDKFKGGYVLISCPISATHGKAAPYVKREIELYCKHGSTKATRRTKNLQDIGIENSLLQHFNIESRGYRRVTKR